MRLESADGRPLAEDRLAVLRGRFAAAVGTIHELLSRLAPEDWARVCSAEGWSVALEGLHIGLGLRRQRGFLDDAFVRGAPADFSWDETHELNADIAKRRQPHPRFVVGFLQEEAERVQSRLAGFTPADLERQVIGYEGRMLTLDQFMRGFLIGHIEGHTASIRSALGR